MDVGVERALVGQAALYKATRRISCANGFTAALANFRNSEELLHDLIARDDSKKVDLLARDKVRLVPPSGPTETDATVAARRGQPRWGSR